ncbi:MAG: ADP-heptose-lipooligosaccharide heptosyltransferase [Gammaproteobacteria bacterium]|jgi:heptosyltransferase I|nr:ADP-heptose-lipooligosaccharide heptosyltransferase [Gammaproteobacteria bacterium]
MLPLAEPPRSICILRLSALGDTCHVVPIVRTLQHVWPATQLTWIVGKAEARLMSLVDGVEFITVDKRAGFGARHALREQLRGRRFDVLLHMQLALRASLIARSVPATVKLGFDRARARDLQWMFTNARIAPRTREHVLDSFFGFLAALGIKDRQVRWDIPLPESARAYAEGLIPDKQPTLIISPCSSHVRRNWRAERYAAIADHAARRYGMRVILCGGPSKLELETGAAIEKAANTELTNQIGRDTLPELLALLARATVLLTPDSGPAHMATMVGTPVLGLYAATNPARSGPYLSRLWCVDAYPEAARRFRGRSPDKLPWTEKIEARGIMDLISVERVAAKLDELLR